MPIQGLTNQWETYDELLNRFAAIPGDAASASLVAKYAMIRELLMTLHESTDSTIYVGTSHCTMIFGTQDAITHADRTQPFAFIEVVDASKTPGEHAFRVKTREIDRNRPTSNWIVCTTTDADIVAKMVREALLYADVPQRKRETLG